MWNRDVPNPSFSRVITYHPNPTQGPAAFPVPFLSSVPCPPHFTPAVFPLQARSSAIASREPFLPAETVPPLPLPLPGGAVQAVRSTDGWMNEWMDGRARGPPQVPGPRRCRATAAAACPRLSRSPRGPGTAPGRNRPAGTPAGSAGSPEVSVCGERAGLPSFPRAGAPGFKGR